MLSPAWIQISFGRNARAWCPLSLLWAPTVACHVSCALTTCGANSAPLTNTDAAKPDNFTICIRHPPRFVHEQKRPEPSVVGRRPDVHFETPRYRVCRGPFVDRNCLPTKLLSLGSSDNVLRDRRAAQRDRSFCTSRAAGRGGRWRADRLQQI